MAIDLDISAAWLHAAVDLNIRVVAPVLLKVFNGQEIQFEAHILDFGSPNGAIATSKLSAEDVEPDPDRVLRELKSLGHWVSVLYPSYKVYERQFFIDTLDDWQWFGAINQAPDWYSGKPWS